MGVQTGMIRVGFSLQGVLELDQAFLPQRSLPSSSLNANPMSSASDRPCKSDSRVREAASRRRSTFSPAGHGWNDIQNWVC